VVQPTNYAKALDGILDESEVSKLIELSGSAANKERIKQDANQLAAEGCV
jgi:hypothetical protein